MHQYSTHSRLVEEVKQRYIGDDNVRAILLSGSIARAQVGKFSDIDVVLIVKEKRPYIRYHAGDLEIEIDSQVLDDIPRRLQENPMSYYIFSELTPLYDPEGLHTSISGEARKFREAYKATHRVKGDLFVWLNHSKMKIESALDEGDTQKAVFFSEVTLWKMIEVLYVINDVVSPPVTHAFRGLLNLGKRPPKFPSLLGRLLEGQPGARVSATLELISFLIPFLQPSMKEFPQHYQPWEARPL